MKTNFRVGIAFLGMVFGVCIQLPGAHAFAQSAPVNNIIDLTVPLGQQPYADAAVFDESVSFVPNFSIDQKAPALSDLFGKDGSALCFPTSLAEVLIDLIGYHSPKVFLPLAGIAADHLSIDPNALVRSLATACHTNHDTGTNSVDGLRCLLAIQAQAGLANGGTTLINPYTSDASLPIQNREVTINDIRLALKAGHPIILQASWFNIDPISHRWVRPGGHFVSIYGYNYNRRWGADQIELKVLNPLTDYGPTRQTSWSTITMSRIARQPGFAYPAHSSFTLSGSGFGHLSNRALVGSMLVVAPN